MLGVMALDIDPVISEAVKTTSAGILALLAIYTAYRLARSKNQIVRVYRTPSAIHVVNAGESVVFVEACGAVGRWGRPLDFVMLHEMPQNGRVEPGQRMKWPIERHDQDPPGAYGSKHAWVELQSGRRVTSHHALDPRGWLAKWRPRDVMPW